MELSKQQKEKMLKKYSCGKEFKGYSYEEIFQLGMEEALEVAGVTIPEIDELKKQRERYQ